MVDIREDDSPQQGDAAAAGDHAASSHEHAAGGGPSDFHTRANGGVAAVVNHIKLHSTESLLWILRISTVVFSVFYIVPIIGSQQSHYQRTLLAAAATNALRLHQRVAPVRLSADFFRSLFVEDACHYLCYSLLFLSVFPITMALFPVALFAFLHASNFTLHLLNIGQFQHWPLHRILRSLIDTHSQNILMLIASTEIFLMPMIVAMIFVTDKILAKFVGETVPCILRALEAEKSGKSSIVMPFIYYRFLVFRYLSRRNPKTREAFCQMRLALEQAVSGPGCPAVIRNLAYRGIGLVERMCPVYA